MPRTQIPGHLVRDGGLAREDMNILTPGQAMITRLVVGSGLEMSETGGDTGTGEVTVDVKSGAGIGYQRIDAVFKDVVPATGLKALGFDTIIPHTLVGFYIPVASVIRQAILGVDLVDPDRTFEFRIYSDPTGTPVYEYTLATLGLSQNYVNVTGLNFNLDAGDYGLFVSRASGTGKSVFKSGAGTLIFEEQ